MLEKIREMSGKLFIFFSSINQNLDMLEKKLAREQIMPTIKLLGFIFRYGNRAHFIEI